MIYVNRENLRSHNFTDQSSARRTTMTVKANKEMIKLYSARLYGSALNNTTLKILKIKNTSYSPKKAYMNI